MNNLNDLLEFAISSEKIITFDYTDSKGKITKRRVLPKEIKDNKLYGHDIEKEALRCFVLDRIVLGNEMIDLELPEIDSKDYHFDIPF